MKLNKAIDRFKNELEPPELMDRFNSLGLDTRLYSYDSTKPNLIYTGQGITNELHIGHQFVYTKLIQLQDMLRADTFFMYSSDEKFLQFAKPDEDTINRVKQFYSAMPRTQFHDNMSDINKQLYGHALYFARAFKSNNVDKTLGKTGTLSAYYYAPMQCAPLLLKLDTHNIFIVTAAEQMPYFNLAHTVLKHDKLRLANYLIVPTIPNLKMNGKMSSRDQQNTIFLNDDLASIHIKTKLAKSYGVMPTVDTLKQDFCYTITGILGLLTTQRLKYSTGKIRSVQFKNLTAKALYEYINHTNY